MALLLEIERDETRRRNAAAAGLPSPEVRMADEDLADLQMTMKRVGRPRSPAPDELRASDDFELEGLRTLDIDYDEMLITQMNHNIDEVVQDLQDLDEIQATVAEQVVEQGQALRTIESNMESAQENTGVAVKELGEARKIQSKTRTTKIILGSASSCALAGAAAGAVLGPAGSATGLVAGAVVGGVVGGMSGAGIGYGVGKAMDQSKAVDWELIDGFNATFLISCEEVPSCMSCGKEFGMIRHPHNCLVCGGVFCRECTKKRRVEYEGVERKVKGKVCEFCRNAYKAELFFQAGAESTILHKSKF